MEEVEADEIISPSDVIADKVQSSRHQNENPSAIRKAPKSARMLNAKLILVNMLVNFLMFTITGFITYHCFNKATVLFLWHPTFMCIGYLIFMSQAILTLSGANILTYKLHHKTRILIHWVLQSVAGLLITTAFVCIYINKIRMGKAHFQTLHGIFGLFTIICTLASIAGGVFTKYGFQLRHIMRPITSKILHGVTGTSTYVVSSITIALGVYSKWFQEDNTEQVRLALLIGLIAVTLYVILNPVAATISRTKAAIRTTL